MTCTSFSINDNECKKRETSAIFGQLYRTVWMIADMNTALKDKVSGPDVTEIDDIMFTGIDGLLGVIRSTTINQIELLDRLCDLICLDSELEIDWTDCNAPAFQSIRDGDFISKKNAQLNRAEILE